MARARVVLPALDVPLRKITRLERSPLRIRSRYPIGMASRGTPVRRLTGRTAAVSCHPGRDLIGAAWVSVRGLREAGVQAGADLVGRVGTAFAFGAGDGHACR